MTDKSPTYWGGGQQIGGLIRVKIAYKEPNGNEVTLEGTPGTYKLRVINKPKVRQALDVVIERWRKK